MVNDTQREPASIVAVRRTKFTQRFHDLFGRLAPLAESCSVSMNVENIDGSFDSAYRTADEILSITEPVGSPAMGVCVDSGHAHMTGLSPAEMIRRLGPRLRETHFHDNRGATDDHRPVGIGTIDWVDVIVALDEVGFAHPVVFEWAGTYWSKLEFAPIARTFYANWRQFEDYVDSLGLQEPS
jgi:sugar phosphate isomerase/epimerase